MCVLDYQKASASTMLNLFPIQWLALLAYFILRVIVGLALITLGMRHVRHFRELAGVARIPLLPIPRTAITLLITTELVAGTLLVLGFLTQAGALLLIILSLKMLLWHGRFPHPSIPPRLTYVLFLAAGLSLLITGAGAFAFDLPI